MIPQVNVNKNSGSYYDTFVLDLTASFPNCEIYYTIDGTIPSVNSNLYTAPIEIYKTMTVNAIAKKDSAISSVYSFNYYLPQPQIAADKITGLYDDPTVLKLSTNLTGYDIFYTDDGTIPTIKSKKYTNSIKIDNSTKIKAISIKKDSSSNVLSEIYIINDNNIPVGSGTNIQGASAIVEGDVIWKRANSPYNINSNILISEGARLFIEPGVQIKISENCFIRVNGSLFSYGNDKNKVFFTGKTTALWDAIQINSPYYIGKTLLSYTNISGAKIGINTTQNCDLNINNSIISNNSSGINSQYDGVTINDSTISYNSTYGVNGKANINGCIIKNNGTDGIVFLGGNINNSTISNNSSGINSQYDGVTINNSTVSYNSTYGINGKADINGCIIKNNGTDGIIFVGGTVNKCEVINNLNAGINIKTNYLSVLGSKILGNKIGILNDNSFYTNVNGNSIYNNTDYNVKINANKATNMTLDFKNNYWGTTDISAIRDNICDYYFDFDNLPKALIEPLLTTEPEIYNKIIFVEMPKNQDDIVITKDNLKSISTIKLNVFAQESLNTAIYASFYKNKKLLGVKCLNVYIPYGNSEYIIPIGSNYTNESDEVKLLLWNENLVPYAKFETGQQESNIVEIVGNIINQNDAVVTKSNLNSLRNVKFNIVTAENISATIYVGFYNENKLLGIEKFNNNILSGTTQQNLAFNNIVPTNTNKLKLFIWNNNLMPYVKEVEIK